MAERTPYEIAAADLAAAAVRLQEAKDRRNRLKRDLCTAECEVTNAHTEWGKRRDSVWALCDEPTAPEPTHSGSGRGDDAGPPLVPPSPAGAAYSPEPCDCAIRHLKVIGEFEAESKGLRAKLRRIREICEQ
jgi:hypothetical protein